MWHLILNYLEEVKHVACGNGICFLDLQVKAGTKRRMVTIKKTQKVEKEEEEVEEGEEEAVRFQVAVEGEGAQGGLGK